KVGNYIKSGVFDHFDGYKDLLWNIKLRSEIPSVLQAMDKAQSLISAGHKNIIFERKSTSPDYDIDVGVVGTDGSWSIVYQLKYVEGIGNVSKNATKAAKQLVKAPATDKWIEIKVHNGTWADFQREGREKGIKTTFKSTYPNINLRIIFSDGTEKVY
ncbi:MAG: hypothetical protein F6K47_34675, partial [Symploca sp. SIO2E6]|nr:hypothetical protein [Symploca sp. SIO2E6]